MTRSPVRAIPGVPGIQIVHVTVRGGYRPQTVVARAGVPLRLVFHRDEEAACSERVIFSSPHLDRHLAPHGATVVELPPQGPGEVRFTCAMGRYRGRIRLQVGDVDRGEPGPVWLGRPVVWGTIAALILALVFAALFVAAGPRSGPLPLAVLVAVLATAVLAFGSRVAIAFGCGSSEVTASRL